MVKCMICREGFKRMTWKHLHFKHGLTIEEYRRMGGRTGVEKHCPICGEMFVPDRRKQVTCSLLCGHIWSGQKLSGENNPNFGKHFEHTEETKRKISENNCRFWLGKKRPEVGKKIAVKLKGRPNLALKGRKFPGRKNEGQFRKDIIPWNKGRTGVYTEEQLRRISEGTKRNTPRGENHPHWKGGDIKRRDRSTESYIKWRTSVYERDNYTCQICKQRGGRLSAHHIKSWKVFPSLRFDVENGVTLCIVCHCRLHFKKDLGPEYMKFLQS